jgi:hypothetical protein
MNTIIEKNKNDMLRLFHREYPKRKKALDARAKYWYLVVLSSNPLNAASTSPATTTRRLDSLHQCTFDQ